MSRQGMAKVIVADPYRGRMLPTEWEELEGLEELGAPDSLLLLWIGVAGIGLLDGSARGYLKALDYEPLAVHTWERVGGEEYGSPPLPMLSTVGLSTSELFIVARRGIPDISRWGMPPHTNSVHVWRAPANPSHKPEGFYRWVEEQAAGPYLALWTNPNRAKWEVRV